MPHILGQELPPPPPPTEPVPPEVVTNTLLAAHSETRAFFAALILRQPGFSITTSGLRAEAEYRQRPSPAWVPLRGTIRHYMIDLEEAGLITPGSEPTRSAPAAKAFIAHGTNTSAELATLGAFSNWSVGHPRTLGHWLFGVSRDVLADMPEFNELQFGILSALALAAKRRHRQPVTYQQVLDQVGHSSVTDGRDIAPIVHRLAFVGLVHSKYNGRASSTIELVPEHERALVTLFNELQRIQSSKTAARESFKRMLVLLRRPYEVRSLFAKDLDLRYHARSWTGPTVRQRILALLGRSEPLPIPAIGTGLGVPLLTHKQRHHLLNNLRTLLYEGKIRSTERDGEKYYELIEPEPPAS